MGALLENLFHKIWLPPPCASPAPFGGSWRVRCPDSTCPLKLPHFFKQVLQPSLKPGRLSSRAKPLERQAISNDFSRAKKCKPKRKTREKSHYALELLLEEIEALLDIFEVLSPREDDLS